MISELNESTVRCLSAGFQVLKMNVSHYQNQRLAMKELGYRPFKYEFSDVVKLYIKETYPELSDKYAVGKYELRYYNRCRHHLPDTLCL